MKYNSREIFAALKIFQVFKFIISSVQFFIFLLLGNLLFFVDQDLKQVSQDLDSLFYLAFDQIKHAFREVLVELHPLARQVMIGCTLKAKIRFVIVFLL